MICTTPHTFFCAAHRVDKGVNLTTYERAAAALRSLYRTPATAGAASSASFTRGDVLRGGEVEEGEAGASGEDGASEEGDAAGWACSYGGQARSDRGDGGRPFKRQRGSSRGGGRGRGGRRARRDEEEEEEDEQLPPGPHPAIREVLIAPHVRPAAGARAGPGAGGGAAVVAAAAQQPSGLVPLAGFRWAQGVGEGVDRSGAVTSNGGMPTPVRAEVAGAAAAAAGAAGAAGGAVGLGGAAGVALAAGGAGAVVVAGSAAGAAGAAGEAGAAEAVAEGLNSSQAAAVALALRHRFALFQGPPGTGGRGYIRATSRTRSVKRIGPVVLCW